MLLESVVIERYRNFTEPQTMTVEPAVTCLIGKNESGKTTILKALHRLNPANIPDDFDVTKDYPRRFLAQDRRKENLDEVIPVNAIFRLDEDDAQAIEDVLGVTPPESTRVEAWRTYGGDFGIGIGCAFREALEAACNEAGVDHDDDLAEVGQYTSIREASAAATTLAKSLKESGKTARGKAVGKIANELKKYTALVTGEFDDDLRDVLDARLPKFFYFSTYETLEGEYDLTELADRAANRKLLREDSTILALLELASGVGPQDFLDEDYDSRKAELQAASHDLSRQVFRYWKQNDALTVRFDTDMPIVEKDAQGHEIRHRILKIELEDERHGVHTNFSTRSAGFQWFFSFLAAFSAYQGAEKRVVVLLDEPGTSLHGEAQKDFLRYIFGELGTTQQVLYTTHSQHMIDPTRYETMRAVHDRATRENPELGVAITPVSLSADPHTILPVEAALGYSVAQHLFLGSGPHLAVEGSSDFIFLTRMSEHLTAKQRTGLDVNLSIIPVGGIGNMPAFVALMGRRLQVRALVDGERTTSVADKVYQAAKARDIDDNRIVVLGKLDGLPTTADIEDLFTTKDYLWLYSRAVHSLQEEDLPDTPEPILRRIGIARQRAGMNPKFDHVGPAHHLTRNSAEFFAQADPETLDRFEKVFRLVNVS
ncbi:AAA family ATPase [Streptomyces aidingensis]|uniref:AAA ATPase domain-containing protein n=1 Tax=Streptomyces aidingensis TaxID=910347 RepID=A0A1I1KPJ4_9ACTN|nr:AAA family ATPase [Streptomyces aidingensis]SFC62707.1 AAA ATPase domain-containing protein [Streptomyces aidingensis]